MTETLDLILQGIQAMFIESDIVEVRVPKAGKYKTISGYFRVGDGQKLATALQKLSGDYDGIYVTLNPCKEALYSRAADRLEYHAAITTSDHDILHRVHLLVDIDPVRPAGVSATDEEIAQARLVTIEAFKFLKSLGWATPLTAKSGNGFHLIYNIDLPNTKENTLLIQTALKTLSSKFDNEFAKVDTSVFNAARIVKAYGTLAAKGDSTPERPHRVAEVMSASDGVVTEEQLQALAAMFVPPAAKDTHNKATGTTASSGVSDPDKMTEFLEFHGLGHQNPTDGTKPGQIKWVLDECPFNPDHVGKDAAVFLTPGHGMGFRCLHNSCVDNHWREFRVQVETKTGKKFYFQAPGRSLIVREPGMEPLPPVAQTWKSLSDIQPEKLQWLWPNKLPLGANTIFAGDPSLGKTLILIDLAARGSVGDDFVDGEANTFGVFETIILSAEDDPATTIVPRLIGMHADLTKIHTLEHVNERQGGKIQKRGVRLDKDLELIREKLEAHPDIRLIIIDPLSNYLGTKDGFREQEIRAVLMPVTEMAQKYGVAVVTVAHNSKAQGRSAMHKTIGAVGLVGVARMGWTFLRDPENQDNKLMLQMKENLGKFSGIKYNTKTVMINLHNEEIPVAGIQYLGVSTAKAENIIMQSEDFKEKSVLPAMAFIRARMAPGDHIPIAPLMEEAGAQGISVGQLEAARIKLGIDKVKAGNGVRWMWPTLGGDHGESQTPVAG